MTAFILKELVAAFTEKELRAKHRELIEALHLLETIEEEKHNAAKHFSEEIKTVKGNITALRRQIEQNGEPRQVKCEVKFHSPRQAVKEIFRTDTGELVEIQPMTPEECQENLFRNSASASDGQTERRAGEITSRAESVSIHAASEENAQTGAGSKNKKSSTGASARDAATEAATRDAAPVEEKRKGKSRDKRASETAARTDDRVEQPGEQHVLRDSGSVDGGSDPARHYPD